MHDRSHVARFQSFSGEIALQNDSVMFFDRFTFHALCGYAVTNLATSMLLSTIQIVCSIKQIIRDLLTLHNGLFGIGQFHCRTLPERFAIVLSDLSAVAPVSDHRNELS